MPLMSIGDLRRLELKRAAFEVLQKEGVKGATLEKVAAHAGASKGIVLHYFADKRQLFEHTMRHANALLRDAVVARLRTARDPRERLWAVIEANFTEEFFRPSICHAWLSLCAEVPRDRQLARIQTVIHARMRSNLLSALRPLLPAKEAETVALAITTLIDGLWLRAGLADGGLSSEAALAQMRDYLAHRLPSTAAEERRVDLSGANAIKR